MELVEMFRFVATALDSLRATWVSFKGLRRESSAAFMLGFRNNGNPFSPGKVWYVSCRYAKRSWWRINAVRWF